MLNSNLSITNMQKEKKKCVFEKKKTYSQVFFSFFFMLDFAITANDVNLTLRLLNGSSQGANVQKTAEAERRQWSLSVTVSLGCEGVDGTFFNLSALSESTEHR